MTPTLWVLALCAAATTLMSGWSVWVLVRFNPGSRWVAFMHPLSAILLVGTSGCLIAAALICFFMF